MNETTIAILICLCLSGSVWALLTLLVYRRLRPQRDDADAVSELQKLKTELEALTGRIDAQVGQRINALQQLLDKTDQATAESASLPQKPSTTTSNILTLQKHACHLNKQGQDPVAIARELGIDVGRVELMLALQRAAADQPEATS